MVALLRVSAMKMMTLAAVAAMVALPVPAQAHMSKDCLKALLENANLVQTFHYYYVLKPERTGKDDQRRQMESYRKVKNNHDKALRFCVSVHAKPKSRK